jgi:hypothetical protein
VVFCPEDSNLSGLYRTIGLGDSFCKEGDDNSLLIQQSDRTWGICDGRRLRAKSVQTAESPAEVRQWMIIVRRDEYEAALNMRVTSLEDAGQGQQGILISSSSPEL